MFIYQHLGLGDHLICNGMVRFLINQRSREERHHLFCKPHNKATVVGMYRDVKNLSIIPYDDFGVRTYFHANAVPASSIWLIGHIEWQFPERSFEKNFYAQQNVDFSQKWDSFKAEEDPIKSIAIKHYLSHGEPYIFVHDDHRYKIDQSKITPGIKIVRPDRSLTENIIDFAEVIRGAQEVHCIESSFAFMIDLMNLNSNFTIHRYARPLSTIEIPEYRNVKEILS